MTPLSPEKNRTKKPREIRLASELTARGKENFLCHSDDKPTTEGPAPLPLGWCIRAELSSLAT